MEKDVNRLLRAGQTLHPKLIDTFADLGRFLNVSDQVITNWKARGLPKGRILEFASAIGCSATWLATGDGDMTGGQPEQASAIPKSNISTRPRPIKVFDDQDPLTEDEIEVPRLTLKLSAGNGIAQWEVDTKGTPNRYRKSWSQRKGYDPTKLVTVVVDGDSMYPILVDGGSVVINTADLKPRPGDIYAIMYRGDFFIKRLFMEANGSLRVTSDNTDKIRYPDWLVPPEHEDVLQILGKAVQTQNDL